MIQIEIEIRTNNVSSHNDVSTTMTSSQNLRIVPVSKSRVNRLKRKTIFSKSRIIVSSMGPTLEQDQLKRISVSSKSRVNRLKRISVSSMAQH